jgi:phosphoribosyl 1,2-cyclic phosphodiesterase
MLYATDTEYVKYTFKGLTAALIEANYSEEYVNRDEAKFRHVMTGHMSIETSIECIKANMNDGLKNIILCHLSKDNSDPLSFKESVKAIVPDGVQVYIATPKLTVELNRKENT